MISLYRGELHKVSGVPRQWIVPKSQIPVSVFRKALKKRNAALSKLLQPAPVPKTDVTASPVANGTGEASNFAFDGDSGDLDKRGWSENDEDSKADRKPENGGGSLDDKPAESRDLSEGLEGDSGRKQERKRRREDNFLDEREGSAKRDGDLSEETSRGKSKGLQVTSEPMIIDGEDQPEAMDCDFTPGKTVIDSDGSLPQQVRVRVVGVGPLSESESKLGNGELVMRDAGESKQKDVASTRRNGELLHFESVGTVRVQLPSSQIVATVADENGGAGSTDVRVMDEGVKRREELEAKLEKLRAEKHRFVLRLKKVLNEEDVKKRSVVTTGSPGSLQGAGSGFHDSTGAVAHIDKHVVGGSRPSADLEDGELEYARTPSPPLRATPSTHGSQSGHNTPGPPPVASVSGRQTSLSQHLSQTAAGRGGYYSPGVGLPPSPGAPGVTGGAPSPGTNFMGNHSYSHNLAMQQHAAAIYAQKVTSASHGHGQFSSISPGGPPGGTGPGVSGGPPGFSGYPLSSSVHSHHSNLAQSASSSSPHVAGQQAVSASLLTTPRGPPAYHDMRLGGSTWIQR